MVASWSEYKTATRRAFEAGAEAVSESIVIVDQPAGESLALVMNSFPQALNT
jgi:hypothetical protein